MEHSTDLQITNVETPCENCDQFQCTCQDEIENYNQTITIFKYKDFKIKLSPIFSGLSIIFILLRLLLVLLLVLAGLELGF